jgi:hypothetical protein
MDRDATLISLGDAVKRPVREFVARYRGTGLSGSAQYINKAGQAQDTAVSQSGQTHIFAGTRYVIMACVFHAEKI